MVVLPCFKNDPTCAASPVPARRPRFNASITLETGFFPRLRRGNFSCAELSFVAQLFKPEGWNEVGPASVEQAGGEKREGVAREHALGHIER